jgi:hypothetical protein
VKSRVGLLRALIRDSLYVVNESAVADAVVTRAMVRLVVAEPAFRSEHKGPQIRSFRRDPGARSFRLSRSPGLRDVHH